MTAAQLAVFDLDGVIADTARLHYVAWKRLADELGIAFDEAANEALKGIDRMGSLELILGAGRVELGEADKGVLAARKNAYYLAALEDVGTETLLPGAVRLIDDAAARGLRLALASASRNAPLLLAKIGIAHRFEFIADPACCRPKPAPDLFLACATQLGVEPGAAIGFEDAAAGIEAIKAAGMQAVGIGEAVALPGADLVFATTQDVDLDAVLRARA